MIENEQLNKMIKDCKTSQELYHLQNLFANEIIGRITDKQALKILKAQKELLISDEESKQLMGLLNGKNVNETLMILNTYLENKEEGVSTGHEKGMTHTLSNPNVPKFMISNEDDGSSNIILLSIALILLAIIVLIIIFI